MYLISYGTRPELIKLIPLIKELKKKNKVFLTLFTGQHKDLINDLYNIIDRPNIILEDVMIPGQSLNQLVSRILFKMDDIYLKYTDIKNIIIQGDTSSAYAIALSGFHNKKKIIHLEAGLRSHEKYSPFPEEINRKLISQLADIHLCPTILSVENLKKENITDNVYLVGNTIVDIYKYIIEKTIPPDKIQEIINNNKEYIVVTLHRRENRGEKMNFMWKQLNKLSSKYKFIYITHPSLPDSKNILDNTNIILLDPQDYESMVHLISNSKGIISDSGGLQEEAVCANKKVLVCRDTTERPETIDCGLGKLIDTQIIENIHFFDEEIINLVENPYGKDVCKKIIYNI